MTLSLAHEQFCQAIASGKPILDALDGSGIALRTCKDAKGFYVYVLVDPRNASVFYVGKGKNKRARAHFDEWRLGTVVNGAKSQRIKEIAAAKMRPCALLIEDGLNEDRAFEIERLMIYKIGRKNLTNAVKGQRSEAAKILFEVCQDLRCLRLPQKSEDNELFLEIAIQLMEIRDWARERLGMPKIGERNASAS